MIYTSYEYTRNIVEVRTFLKMNTNHGFAINGLPVEGAKKCKHKVDLAISNCGLQEGISDKGITFSDYVTYTKGLDLPVALALLAITNNLSDVNVFAMGALTIGGTVKKADFIQAGLFRIRETNPEVQYAIVPSDYSGVVPSGIKYYKVRDLLEAFCVLKLIKEGNTDIMSMYEHAKEEGVKFLGIGDDVSLDTVKGFDGLKYAMAVAIAGRHHMLAYGAPGDGKGFILSRMGQLQPLLSTEESEAVDRILTIAGYDAMVGDGIRPLRMPHQTASIEGMCGGGAQCMPGEISLAHKGILYLDEAAEFRSSVLQMLRVPLETKSITLSHAGRITIYPADFQLIMATSPCPCGNHGVNGRICICSQESVKQYWKKFSSPLLDRIDIKYNCDDKTHLEDGVEWKLNTLRELIANAWKIQKERQGKFNSELSYEELMAMSRVNFTPEAKSKVVDYFVDNEIYTNAKKHIISLAFTIADMNDDREVSESYVNKAIELIGKIPVDID